MIRLERFIDDRVRAEEGAGWMAFDARVATNSARLIPEKSVRPRSSLSLAEPRSVPSSAQIGGHDGNLPGPVRGLDVATAIRQWSAEAGMPGDSAASSVSRGGSLTRASS